MKFSTISVYMASRREALEKPLKQGTMTLDHFVMVLIHARQVIRQEAITRIDDVSMLGYFLDTFH